VNGGDVNGTAFGTSLHSGNFQAIFGPDLDIGSLTQSVATTPGASYTVGFF